MPIVEDLVNKYNGHIFGITGPDQGQCTAVPHAWEEMLGLPIVYGNAKDTYDNAPADLYVKTLNIPGDLNNFPQGGDIIVWDGTWGGGYGHTAVVVGANGLTFDCLEQNDGDGGVTHVGRHDFAHITGWFRPRLLDGAPSVTPATPPPPTTNIAPVPSAESASTTTTTLPPIQTVPDPNSLPDPTPVPYPVPLSSPIVINKGSSSMNVSNFYKAIVGGLVAAVSAAVAQPSFQTGRSTLWNAILAYVVGHLLVYITPNKQ